MRQTPTSSSNPENPPNPFAAPDTTGLLEAIVAVTGVFRPYFWHMVAIGAVVVAAAITYAFVAPKSWTATATLLPVEDSSSLATQTLGQFAPLAGGFLKSGPTPTDRLMAILASDTLSRNVIEELNLGPLLFPESWDAEKGEWIGEPKKMGRIVHEMLAKRLSTEVDPVGTIEVSVVWDNPDKAAEIVNAYVANLRAFLNEATITSAKKTRLFLEAQIEANDERLAKAQETLINFSEDSQLVVLDVETSQVLSATSALMTDIAAKEVAVTVLGNFLAKDDPKLDGYRRDIERMRKQLTAITRRADLSGGPGQKRVTVPFQKVPVLTLEYLRLKQRIFILQQVQQLLREELEKTRIREASEEVSFQVIDDAVPPFEKSAPRRKLVAIVGVVLATFAAVGYGLLRYYVSALRALGAARLEAEGESASSGQSAS